MKCLPVRSAYYRSLERGYRTYLEILGYAPATIRLWPVHIRELLHYLEGREVLRITAVKADDIAAFMRHIRTRPHQREEGGALSGSSINIMVNAVAVFMRYLQHSGVHVGAWPLDREVAVSTRQTVLTLAEIRRLYEATFHPYRENSVALGQRDRAIIGVLYGCGLRRQEALGLNVGDVDLDRRMLLVRSGKGGKQRYVPIAGGHALDMGRYLEEGRNWFLQSHFYDYRQARYGKAYALKAAKDAVAFFVGQHGERLLDFYQRLAVMGERAGLERAVAPHGLRHSIATHLLHSGMEIEEIARFLGHASLASTQVYTHILNESTRA